MRKFLRITNNIISTIIVLLFTFVLSFVVVSYVTMPNPSIEEIKNPPYTSIYSDNGSLVEILGKDKKQYVEYDDLPPLLISALISIEDATFFDHEGIDYARTLQAFIHNLSSSNKHGGSTITQQLVKNMYLSNEQTYKRKIQEAFLAYKIESILTKEEILTRYFNYVYFEQSLPGVSYAARTYFSKDVKDLTLPEMAILAGVVKSASYYNPLKYPKRADDRKNLVLRKMYEQNYISKNEYEAAVIVDTASLINHSENDEISYQFQAYLDVVYLEVKDLLNIDPFTQKVEIYTYLDTSIQEYLDRIQSDEVIDFKDDLLQIGGCVLNNDDSSIIGVIGGRKYEGARLFSRAYSLVRQPASTIKPVFGYLLASNYLNYNGATSVKDEPYTYPGSSFSVQNADKSYLGNISVEEALGYSKNTSALFTLEKVINRIGIDKTIEYLKEVDLWDGGPFAYSYGIGGFTNGISPIQLAGAYRILNSQGKYIAPSTIRMVKDAKTKEILYERNMNETQVVSKESAFKINKTLQNVVKNNYYGIGVISPNNTIIGGKTGTNGYDKSIAKALNYPTNADKDSWIAGFSSTHTITIWAGFDKAEKDKNTYFGQNDERRRIPKKLFKIIMEKVAINKDFFVPNNLKRIFLVKHADDYYLPNKYIPSSYLVEGYFDENHLPSKVLPEPQFPEINNTKVIYFPNEIIIDIEINNLPKEHFDYTQIFGARGYLISYKKDGETIEKFFESEHITFDEDFSKIDELEIKSCYALNHEISSPSFGLIF